MIKLKTITRIILTIISLPLLGLGLLFIIAAFNPGYEYRLIIGSISTLIALAILYIAHKPQPKIMEVKVTWEPSGKLKTQELTCPYCRAPLPPPKPGQEYIKCPYCGKTIKITEEPIW